MNTPAIINLLVSAAIILWLGSTVVYLKSNLRDKDEQLHDLYERYKTRGGGTSVNGVWINYSIASFDYGKTWYVMDKDDKVIGECEKVHPGLLKTISGWDAIYELSKDGPIQSLTPDVKNAFENAGFTIGDN